MNQQDHAVPDPQPVEGLQARVFLSYSRKDLAAAQQLHGRLVDAGFDAYLDRHDVLPGEPWQERLARLIEAADAVAFLLSPDSVVSPMCDWEVNEAERLSKRVLPVVVRDVPDAAVPGRLKRLNYVFLRHEGEWAEGLQSLSAALHVDIGWVREHTRLGELAADWERRSRLADLLLRGSALSASELWLSQPHAPGQAPALRHTEFIAASRRAEVDRLEQEKAQVERSRRFQKRASWGLGGIAALLLAGVVIAAVGYRETSRREARIFTSKAKDALGSGNLPLALRYAVAGLPSRGALALDYWSPELEELLARVARRYTPMLASLSDALAGYGAEVRVDPGSDRALVLGNGKAALWNTQDGRTLLNVPHREFALLRHGRAVIFDGEHLSVVNSETGAPIARHAGLGNFRFHTNSTQTHVVAAWSKPSFSEKAVRPQPLLVRVFSVTSGQELASLAVPDEVGHEVDVSSDGSRAAFMTRDGGGHVFDLASGQAIVSLAQEGRSVNALRLFADGARVLAVVAAGQSLTAKVFDAANGRELLSIPSIATDVAGSVPASDTYRVGTRGDFLFRLYTTYGFDQVTPAIQVWNLQNGIEVEALRRNGCLQPGLSVYPSGPSLQSRAIVRCKAQEMINPYQGTAVTLTDSGSQGQVVENTTHDRITVDSYSGFSLYDSVSGEAIVPQRISDSIFTPVFSPDGSLLYGQTMDGPDRQPNAGLRDAGTGAVIARIEPVEATRERGRKIQVDAAVFSERGTWLATRHWSALVLHDGKTGMEVSRVVPDPTEKPSVTGVQFAGRDEDRLITTHDDGSVRLWDISFKPSKGRKLVTDVCTTLLVGAEQHFSNAQMQDPILVGRDALRSPCARVGPFAIEAILRRTTP